MAHITEKQRVGRLGEDIAVKHLENKGFMIIERNYLKKYGEIDIIARKYEIIHFIEVKSVSCEFNPKVPRVTPDSHRPEDNIHAQKLKRLSRTIQAYLLSNYQNEEPEWVFDVVTVKINVNRRQAHIKILEDIIL
jgi:putative endonuclease